MPGALVLVLVLVQLVAPHQASAGQATATGGDGTTFSSFGYGETDIRGGAGRADLFFALLPATSAAGDTLVDLDVSHSGLLVAPSTLTVLAGGVSVASAALESDNASHGHIAFRVPPELVGQSGLALSVRTSLRLSTDQCEDPANPALWVTVHADSSVRLSAQPVARDLRDVASLLTGSRDAPGVELALPVSPDRDVLRAAGVVAAQVGRWQGDKQQDAFVGLAKGADSQEPTVVLTAGASLPAGFGVGSAGGDGAAGAGTLSAEHGLVALAKDGPPQLLVAGATSAALVEGADALGDALSGPVAAFTGVRPSAPVRDSMPWQAGAASFAELGIGRQEVAGLGSREVTLRIDRPSGWTLKSRPQLDLVVDAGAGLDAGSSSLQVQLAGADLGSRRLVPGGAPHTYTFDIPPGLLDRKLDGSVVRSLDLTARFLLNVPHERCQPFDVEAARAALLPTSAFRLPHDDFGGLELGRFPHPLLTSKVRHLAIVLPNAPDSTTLAAGLQLSAGVGRWSDPGSAPPVLTTAADLEQLESVTDGLILLGDADVELLGHPVDIGRGPVAPGPGQAGAVLGVVPSPLARGASALIVHGDGAGLLLAARALSARTSLAQLRGSRIALTGAMPAQTLVDIARPSPPPELAPVLGGRSFVAGRSWAIPAVVLLAGFLAALVVVIRYRWGPARRTAVEG